MEFLELTAQEYADFTRNHPYHNFLNSSEAFQAKSYSGVTSVFVGVKKEKQLIAATGIMFIPILKKFFLAYAQRGFLLDYQDEELLSFFTTQLKKYLKSKKVVSLKIDPYVLYQERNLDGQVVNNGFKNQYVIDHLKNVGFIHEGFTVGFNDSSQARFMMTLNLKDKDANQILKEMDQQTRWSINKTIKLGVKVREVHEDEIEMFENIMHFTSEKKHFNSLGEDYYKTRLQVFGKDNMKLMVSYLDIPEFKDTIVKDREKEMLALHEIEEVLKETPNSKKFIKKKKVQLEALELIDKREKDALELEQKYGKEVIMAASSFIFYGNEVTYLSSGSYDEFRKYNAPYAIQWYMIQEAINRGITRYNFYGTSGIFDESADDYGVYEFKKGFNAIPEELVGDFTLPVNNFVYHCSNLLNQIKKMIAKGNR